MALHDFGNLFEPVDRLHEDRHVLQADADVGADVETEHLGIDHQPAAEDHPRLVELLDALVDGRSRNAAFAGDFQKGHTRIGNQIFENFPIDRVDNNL